MSKDEAQRLADEDKAAGRVALEVLRKVARCSRGGQVLPQEVLHEVINAASELSRCGFDSEEGEGESDEGE